MAIVIISAITAITFLSFMLCKSAKIADNRMEEILKEDSFYHKKTGLLIYLISDYQKKIECTIEKNFQKANNINNSIITIGITFALSILTQIVSIFLFSEETILILFL